MARHLTKPSILEVAPGLLCALAAGAAMFLCALQPALGRDLLDRCMADSSRGDRRLLAAEAECGHTHLNLHHMAIFWSSDVCVVWCANVEHNMVCAIGCALVAGSTAAVALG